MIKILWADDQIEVAKSFATVLEEGGAKIEYAQNGTNALERLLSETFDLVLLDLAMPPGRWGGIWFLEQIKSRGLGTPVIVVSGEGGQSETIQALRLGAVDYVTKEQISNELPAQIAKILSNGKEVIDIARLISNGESEVLEFKSTLRLNLHTNKFDPAIELAVIKSVAAFMNTRGGHVLVGVADDGTILGLASDKFASTDKLELHFRNLVRDSIGAEYSNLITTCVHLVSATHVFSVFCRASKSPVYVSWKYSGEAQKQDLFFVRAGPRTESLGTKQAVSYIGAHFTN